MQSSMELKLQNGTAGTGEISKGASCIIQI